MNDQTNDIAKNAQSDEDLQETSGGADTQYRYKLKRCAQCYSNYPTAMNACPWCGCTEWDQLFWADGFFVF